MVRGFKGRRCHCFIGVLFSFFCDAAFIFEMLCMPSESRKLFALADDPSNPNKISGNAKSFTWRMLDLSYITHTPWLCFAHCSQLVNVRAALMPYALKFNDSIPTCVYHTQNFDLLWHFESKCSLSERKRQQVLCVCAGYRLCFDFYFYSLFFSFILRSFFIMQ